VSGHKWDAILWGATCRGIWRRKGDSDERSRAKWSKYCKQQPAKTPPQAPTVQAKESPAYCDSSGKCTPVAPPKPPANSGSSCGGAPTGPGATAIGEESCTPPPGATTVAGRHATGSTVTINDKVLNCRRYDSNHNEVATDCSAPGAFVYVNPPSTPTPAPILVVPSAKALDDKPVEAVTQCETHKGRPQITANEASYVAKLNQLRQCKEAIDDKAPCNIFLGRALQTLFGNTDFATGRDSFLLANDISNALKSPGNAGWVRIGSGADQNALDRAQEIANELKPVVAVRVGRQRKDGTRGAGHVALVIPGSTEARQFDDHEWGALRAPNAASFFLDHPERVFVGCPLSAVWRKPDEVELYYKP
jgi:hypothetical protein